MPREDNDYWAPTPVGFGQRYIAMTKNNPSDEDNSETSVTISCDEFVVFECDAIYDAP